MFKKYLLACIELNSIEIKLNNLLKEPSQYQPQFLAHSLLMDVIDQSSIVAWFQDWETQGKEYSSQRSLREESYAHSATIVSSEQLLLTATSSSMAEREP